MFSGCVATRVIVPQSGSSPAVNVAVACLMYIHCINLHIVFELM
jgi:hypothetical protein